MKDAPANRRRILVIRLGALGDMALSFTAFAAIRAHHRGDHVTLLTTPPFLPLMQGSPWFDRIETDTRPGWLDLPGLWRLRQKLAGHDFTYDLQTSRRSRRYFVLAGQPPWSGIARGCSHPHDNPNRDLLHTVERQREQLRMAGVTDFPDPDLCWLAAAGPRIVPPYALLIPGTSAAHGGAKRWPAPRFAALAGILAERGITPVVVGTEADSGAASTIRADCPSAADLTGQTSLPDLAGLAARAKLAIGGDTGPVHLAAVMGCRTLALFSRYSDPIQATPVGQVTLLCEPNLADLPLDRVVAALPRT